MYCLYCLATIVCYAGWYIQKNLQLHEIFLYISSKECIFFLNISLQNNHSKISNSCLISIIFLYPVIIAVRKKIAKITLTPLNSHLSPWEWSIYKIVTNYFHCRFFFFSFIFSNVFFFYIVWVPSSSTWVDFSRRILNYMKYI